MLTYRQLDPYEHASTGEIAMEIPQFPTKMHLNIDSKCRPFCPGLNVSPQGLLQYMYMVPVTQFVSDFFNSLRPRDAYMRQ